MSAEERPTLATALLDAVAAHLEHSDGFHPGEDCAWYDHRDALRAAYNAVVEAAVVSVPTEPGAPDPLLIATEMLAEQLAINAGLGISEWDAFIDEARQRISRAASRPVPAPEPSARLDVDRLGASISAVEHSLVRRGLMERLTSMDNFVLAEMIAREYLAATPQDPEA